MKETVRSQIEPDYAVPPGEILLEKIQEMELPQNKLALCIGLSEKHLSGIIHGKEPISSETAIGLERATKINAAFWMNSEMLYRERLARIEDAKRIERDINCLKEVPVKYLINTGAINNTKDKNQQLRDVLDFFGVKSTNEMYRLWDNYQKKIAARKSQALKGNIGKAATWLRLGEIHASQIKTSPYDKNKFNEAVLIIRETLIRKRIDEAIPNIQRICAKAGVAFEVIPEVKGCTWFGASWWFSSNKAIIILNLRGKKDDQFWFSFFHEAGHILSGLKKKIYIEGGSSEDEKMANAFAENILIPPNKLNDIRELRTNQQVINLAEKLNVPPSIIASRYHRLTENYTWFQRHRKTYHWKYDPN